MTWTQEEKKAYYRQYRLDNLAKLNDYNKRYIADPEATVKVGRVRYNVPVEERRKLYELKLKITKMKLKQERSMQFQRLTEKFFRANFGDANVTEDYFTTFDHHSTECPMRDVTEGERANLRDCRLLIDIQLYKSLRHE